MEKTLPGMINKLISNLMSTESWKVQKFNSEEKNPIVWAINKIQSNDDFILRSPEGEYVYMRVDVEKNELNVFYMGLSSVELFRTFKINSDMLFETVKETIVAASRTSVNIAKNYKRLMFS